jgi:hypothetical protein
MCGHASSHLLPPAEPFSKVEQAAMADFDGFVSQIECFASLGLALRVQ